MRAQLLVIRLGAPTHHCEECVVWSAKVKRCNGTPLGWVNLQSRTSVGELQLVGAIKVKIGEKRGERRSCVRAAVGTVGDVFGGDQVLKCR
jgi:hypothetical protein